MICNVTDMLITLAIYICLLVLAVLLTAGVIDQGWMSDEIKYLLGVMA